MRAAPNATNSIRLNDLGAVCGEYVSLKFNHCLTYLQMCSSQKFARVDYRNWHQRRCEIGFRLSDAEKRPG